MPRNATTTRVQKQPNLYRYDGREPTWDVAYLFPPQGAWTEEHFWALEGSIEGNPRIELVNGCLDVLPMPTELHQLIAAHFFLVLHTFVQRHAPGVVLFSGLNVRLKDGNLRVPDVVYMLAKHTHRRHNQCWEGADLIMEVVSPDPEDTKRDWQEKRRDYARARIAEYWIIDPQKKVIRVLTLKGKAYRVHGDFKPGAVATSKLLPGFAVSVAEVLAPPGSKLGK